MICRAASAGGVFAVGLTFFFQAEDGIRDLTVTGVQTCALPIFFSWLISGGIVFNNLLELRSRDSRFVSGNICMGKLLNRSEERRVGKECRYRLSPYH